MTAADQGVRAEAALAEVEAAYGLEPRSLVPVSSAYRTAAAYRSGQLLLKPYRYGERHLYYITGALLHLASLGAAAPVPWLVPAADGEPYVRAGGGLWYATEWISGRPPAPPGELARAARALACFHRAARGYFMPAAEGRSWPVRWQALLADLRQFSAQAGAGRTEFDNAYAREAPGFIRRAEQALESLARSEYRRLEVRARAAQQICHRDATLANLVVDVGGRIWLVDLDNAGPELRIYDLVRLLLSGNVTDARMILQVLQAYEQLEPLDPGERRLLPAAYHLPREFWWAGACRYRRTRRLAEPEQLLGQTIAGAPYRDACVKALADALA